MSRRMSEMADTVRYAIGRTGERIGFDMCFSSDCLQHVSRCRCPAGPTPPGSAAGSDVTVASPPATRPAA